MLIEYTSSLYIVLQASIYALYEFSRRRDGRYAESAKKHLVILFGAASTFLREPHGDQTIAFRIPSRSIN